MFAEQVWNFEFSVEKMKTKHEKIFQKGEIVIYKAKEGPVLEVRLEQDTVWLTQNQIALLFGTRRPAITKHLLNIFRSGELDKHSVSSILEHAAADGKTYKTHFYNLDRYKGFCRSDLYLEKCCDTMNLWKKFLL